MSKTTGDQLTEQSLSPAAWLDHIRTGLGYNKPFRWSTEVDYLINSLPEEDRAAATDVWKSRVGKSIASIHDEQFGRYFERIVPALDEVGAGIAATTYFGLYPTYDFNGYAGHTPRGDRIVMLHAGLPHTLSLWSHLCIRQLEQGGGWEVLERHLNLHHELLNYFSALWHETNIPKIPEVRPQTPDGWRLSEELTMAAVCFVVGHEIGHIKHAHAGYSNDVTSNHQQEFEADRYGLHLCIRYTLLYCNRFDDTYFTKMMLFGPFLALAVIALLAPTDSVTHPSAVRRDEFMLDQFSIVLREILRDRADAFASDTDEHLLDVLKGNARGLIQVGKAMAELVSVLFAKYEKPDNSWLQSVLQRA